MWPGTPRGRRPRCWAARGARCWPGCTAAGAGWPSCWPRRGWPMDGHDRLLAAFLAGDLDPVDARRWDEHLLECERCWRAVREDRAGRQAAELLRRPAPAGLGDRVRFAVELAAANTTAPPHRRLGGRLHWRRLAGAGAVAVGLAVTLLVLLVPGGRASLPASVAAVARYAQAVPPPAGQPGP